MEDNVQPQKQRSDEMLEQTVESALVGKQTVDVAGYLNTPAGNYLMANDLARRYSVKSKLVIPNNFERYFLSIFDVLNILQKYRNLNLSRDNCSLLTIM